MRLLCIYINIYFIFVIFVIFFPITFFYTIFKFQLSRKWFSFFLEENFGSIFNFSISHLVFLKMKIEKI